MQQAQQAEITPLFSKVEFVAIGPGDIGQLWKLAEKHIDLATKLTEKIDTQDIEQKCLLGDMQLWLAVDEHHIYAALITEILTYVSGWKVVRMLACGGDNMQLWKDELDRTITKFARDERCDAVEIIGRAGWGRVYPEYIEIERVFSKPLEVTHD